MALLLPQQGQWTNIWGFNGEMQLTIVGSRFCFKTLGWITYDVLSVHIHRFLRNTSGETSCANEVLKTKEEIHSSWVYIWKQDTELVHKLKDRITRKSTSSTKQKQQLKRGRGRVEKQRRWGTNDQTGVLWLKCSFVGLSVFMFMVYHFIIAFYVFLCEDCGAYLSKSFIH